MKGLTFFLLALMFGFASPLGAQNPSFSNEIVAALDDHLVSIDTRFDGSKVLLFGSTQGEGDVVVVVRGPSATETVRKKERVMGVWANNDRVVFSDTPSFYNVAASGNIEDLVDPDVRAKLEFGPQYLKSYLAPESRDVTHDIRDTFWEALIRIKKRQGLYAAETTPVTFLGDKLFRADFIFPANIEVGTYLVYVYLVKDKQVVSSQITPLFVSKTGIEAQIFDFAQNYGLAFGIVAVLIALFAGWIASVVFRKK